ncbi:bifunctional D-glycero-beta-D-manno-heptose-7-phosphate kinase/D-glycero-beta-D-manno-heptose 1-phosphate adenylyltransferase HldE [Desulfurivibrio alkaliphilus]|nr:bifunctional D-glycero-beta-D-manno-heptose-7-phosphate kinase/D-glycero-beta-D-manno-heptose 1-phosphate adenylyltransferase HldE [Desulfurivibrio alkaliphilus]MDF1614748.1 bifunctional D-glycero-beta-D-manno-heptose-7-phosphate kinase/D-glycero-beta-D-manno-heptose 1-phosphate adenylyltransferase HldE [Desulfurivibrio alkaliphilus]
MPIFERARLLVIGDLILDRYLYGATHRISPEAPVPVLHVDREEEQRAGGAGNVALNIAALGAEVALLGLTGMDEEGATLENILTSQNVRCDFSSPTQQRTINKLRILSRHQQLLRVDREAPFSASDAAPLTEKFRRLLSSVAVAILSDYGKGTLSHSRELVAAAREAGVPVLVDPKNRDFNVYRGATLLTPNLSEFEAVAGESRSETELAERALRVAGECGLDALLVTRGAQGMTLVQTDGSEPLHLPTRAREVFDITGAGDTVIATLGASLAAGLSLPEAVQLANVGAGIVVGKLGTASVSVSDLRRALQDSDDSRRGVLSEEELLAAVAAARAGGERIVMTNGCFDLLHAGHVSYLKQARKLGDRLIVAVNDDASVRALKGAGRPINPLEQRLEVLAGLAAVDWVIPFAEDTPRRLICQVLPDVLVKGGDYRPEQIAGHECVLAAGGEVTVLEFDYACSTSRIIARINQTE